ncbi:MAG: type II toxin-antitoxin system RelE/ParE family toxin [Rhodospirillales bacterium]
MSGKPVRLRQLAEQDIQQTIRHYKETAGDDVAHDFIDELADALERAAAFPATGSQRYALDLDLPGLRFLPLGRFPQLIFYIEHQDFIDVWRVLHGLRDLPSSLTA